MNLDEFKLRKEKLEDELTAVVAGVVAKFEVETGFCPSSISVDIIRREVLGERQP